MKLLLLSNYFTPDLSAGSFRMQALVEALQPWAEQGLSVDLITTRPNRYASMRTEAPAYEDKGWLRIHRIELPAHKNGMVDQARAYVGYARGVRMISAANRWDTVFATSSRLMTACLGAHIARKQGVPLYLDIRDLFTDNMDELLAGSPAKALMPVFRMMERRAFGHASHVNVVSEGFRSHIQRLAPQARMTVMTNGIDAIFSDADFGKPVGQAPLPLIVYAGNMGEGQGLHKIVPDVAKRLSGKARFRLIGDGGRSKQLEEALVAADLNNVELLPPVARASLIGQYREADILFLHLNDLEAFRKVLPSKLFEYGATKKPILAGVSGHAAEFLAEHLPDAEVFEPLDIDAMTQAVGRLIDSQISRDRTRFLAKFSRTEIMKDMASDVAAMMVQAD